MSLLFTLWKLFFFNVPSKEIVGHFQTLKCKLQVVETCSYYVGKKNVISDKPSILPDISFPLFLYLLTTFSYNIFQLQFEITEPKAD